MDIRTTNDNRLHGIKKMIHRGEKYTIEWRVPKKCTKNEVYRSVMNVIRTMGGHGQTYCKGVLITSGPWILILE